MKKRQFRIRQYSGGIRLILMLTIVICVNITAFGQDIDKRTPQPIDADSKRDLQRDVVMTRWMSPDDSRPTSYAEWLSKIGGYQPFKIVKSFRSAGLGTKETDSKICVAVNSTLYGLVTSSIDQYVMDLTGEGFDVSLYALSGGTPDDFRTLLQGLYASGLEGAFLIGDLPVPWYETYDDTSSDHAEFPCDLFYMDMDGIFTDSDYDGMYDTHTGDVAPEIWIGRVTTSPMTLNGANEVDIVNRYFYKDHLYRCDMMPAANRTLVYVDDDWAYWAGEWCRNVGEAYNDRTLVDDEWITWGPDYMSRLPLDYEFVQVCVHSWPGGHAFKNPDEDWSYIYISQIIALPPAAHFYNLFACSNARYVENDYCSGWYIFGQDHGLVSIGSAKTGSMLEFGDFYRPLGEGNNFGEAFRDWFAARAEGGFDQWEIDWFYGMTLHGDPTLRTQSLTNNQTLQYDNGMASYMMILPNGSGLDLYNVRFTPEEACTLNSVSVTGDFSGSTPLRMYIWNSDGTYPTTVIDSVDIPDGNLSYIDLYDRQITFAPYQDFHIGFTCTETAPADSAWFYMDDGSITQDRSIISDNSVWRTLHSLYGTDYNFLIRAEVRYPTPPSIRITTLTLPDGEATHPYDQLISCTDGTEPYNWDLTAGALPNGLLLDSKDGRIVGAPSQYGTFTFSVRVTDSDSPPLSDVQHYSLNIDRACGDADGNGNVNISDVTFLINFLYKEGTPPDPEEIGDADGSGVINLLDVTHLINYLYRNGPAPIC